MGAKIQFKNERNRVQSAKIREDIYRYRGVRNIFLLKKSVRLSHVLV